MGKFEERLIKLNSKQREAVKAIEGSVLVIAGPGSGKTELLAMRSGEILKATQASPSEILLLTFTDNAAINMRNRLVDLIGEDAYRVNIFTFHAFAVYIMNKYSNYFYNGVDYQVANEIERLKIIENIIKNLPKNNPLNTYHEKFGYIYFKSIQDGIKALKKGNFTKEEFLNKVKIIEEESDSINEEVSKIFLEIKGKSKFLDLYKNYELILEKLLKLVNKNNETAKYLMKTLEIELAQAENTGKSNNLTEWKNIYFNKNSDNEFKLVDSDVERINKWKSLAEIYEKYNLEMNKKGYYDFDDMIFVVGRVLEKNLDLRADLAEQYQYIMIDEFQDTSDAQFNLIKQLTDFENNENNPNILAVGDDDQSIFKFQGAELDNITKFKNIYKKTKIITLNKNYRSTQNIIDEARNIILKIPDRLEVRYPKEIDKKILAANQDLIKNQKGKIIEEVFESDFLERDYIAKEVTKLLKNKVNPNEIGIIAKNHKDLQNMALTLNEYNLPYEYEKRENVFEKKPIQEIITIIDFVNSGLDNLKEELLPEILSFDFWNISKIEIWKIAEAVRNYNINKSNEKEGVNYEKASWLKIMLESDNQDIKKIAVFLIELIGKIKSIPLLYLIDEIIGSQGFEIDDEEDIQKIENSAKHKKIFISPFREYYFGKNFKEKKSDYVDFLLALQTFIGALREYKIGKTLYSKDLIEFVEIYKNNDNLSLATINVFKTNKEAVTLQTVHKSKGLEYQYVFILSSDNNSWNKFNNKNNIKFPISLPLIATNNNIDDNIRLYYVAITRAKHTLYITYVKDKFSKLLKNGELEVENNQNKNSIKKIGEIDSKVINSLRPIPKREFLKDEKIILEKILENYTMPVTHLNNYLNLSRVGPEKFVEQNLLRFPQAINPSSAYGSAIHKALEMYYKYISKYNKKPTLETILNNFKVALERQTLNEIDFKINLDSGYKDLEIFIKFLESEEHLAVIKTEVDFKDQGVIRNGVRLSGKIDRIEMDSKNLKVIDYKTGKTLKDWKTDKDYENIKLHFYKYQLAYYYILCKNSKDYAQYNFQEASLEFIESDKSGLVNLLTLKRDDSFLLLVERVEKLTKIVYTKIMNLDFPNTDRYKLKENSTEEKENYTLKDILNFEDDLLAGKI